MRKIGNKLCIVTIVMLIGMLLCACERSSIADLETYSSTSETMSIGSETEGAEGEEETQNISDSKYYDISYLDNKYKSIVGKLIPKNGVLSGSTPNATIDISINKVGLYDNMEEANPELYNRWKSQDSKLAKMSIENGQIIHDEYTNGYIMYQKIIELDINIKNTTKESESLLLTSLGIANISDAQDGARSLSSHYVCHNTMDNVGKQSSKIELAPGEEQHIVLYIRTNTDFITKIRRYKYDHMTDPRIEGEPLKDEVITTEEALKNVYMYISNGKSYSYTTASLIRLGIEHSQVVD